MHSRLQIIILTVIVILIVIDISRLQFFDYDYDSDYLAIFPGLEFCYNFLKMVVSPLKQKFVLFFMGAWMFGTVLMWWVAGQNFNQAQAFISQRSGKTAVLQVDRAALRPILRQFASALNRRFFQIWELIQLTLVAVVLVLVYRQPSEDRPTRIPLLIMAGLVAVFLAVLTPQMIELGRSIDFLQSGEGVSNQRFANLHRTYVIGDVIKFGLGMWVSWRLMRSSPGRT